MLKCNNIATFNLFQTINIIRLRLIDKFILKTMPVMRISLKVIYGPTSIFTWPTRTPRTMPMVALSLHITNRLLQIHRTSTSKPKDSIQPAPWMCIKTCRRLRLQMVLLLWDNQQMQRCQQLQAHRVPFNSRIFWLILWSSEIIRWFTGKPWITNLLISLFKMIKNTSRCHKRRSKTCITAKARCSLNRNSKSREADRWSIRRKDRNPLILKTFLNQKWFRLNWWKDPNQSAKSKKTGLQACTAKKAQRVR